mmetsp:Transcript_38812/g.95506  ORF Transcript_38812/g.95506 Transcript_38812/m.95506 type:complete len:146 (+) Transcript_38812:65-502(+)
MDALCQLPQRLGTVLTEARMKKSSEASATPESLMALGWRIRYRLCSSQRMRLIRHGEQAAKAMKDDGGMERDDRQTANQTRKALWEVAMKTQLIGSLDTTAKGMKEKKDSTAINKVEEERFKRIFRRYDTDVSGSIDGDELHDPP